MKLVESFQDNYIILRISGRLDTNKAGEFEDKILSLLNKDIKKVLMDMTGLEYINSTGLRTLLLATKKLHRDEGFFILYGISNKIKEILDTAGFTSILSIATNEEEAAKMLS